LPRFEVVIPSAKFLPGLRTIALEYISGYLPIFFNSKLVKITLRGTALPSVFVGCGYTSTTENRSLAQVLRPGRKGCDLSLQLPLIPAIILQAYQSELSKEKSPS